MLDETYSDKLTEPCTQIVMKNLKIYRNHKYCKWLWSEICNCLCLQHREYCNKEMANMFPEVKYTGSNELRMKNKKSKRWLCVQNDTSSNNVEQNLKLTTKSLHTTQDHDVDFLLYYFTVAEVNETKLVLPFHQHTKSYLRMTDDKKLQVNVSDITKQSPVLLQDLDNNELVADPRRLRRADARFFYLRSSGAGESTHILEAMNGRLEDYKNFLSTNDNNEDLSLKYYDENETTSAPTP
uniref:Uncharacterized protein n=1 Tax=Timema genevievae TaxID=629358 RepID=A0A7R9JRX9_TIMGE|nr:unnamed protein product [Timema genevievae]